MQLNLEKVEQISTTFARITASANAARVGKLLPPENGTI